MSSSLASAHFLLRIHADSLSRQCFHQLPLRFRLQTIFDALIFVIHDAGFIARCALEISNAAQNRFEKILNIINECKFGIHDISRTELDPTNSLPRFNMPLELGLYLGGKWFGNKTQQTKSCLIFDREPYRYQKFHFRYSGPGY